MSLSLHSHKQPTIQKTDHKGTNIKSLSILQWSFSKHFKSETLQYASFTVEAAFVIPVFLLTVLLVLGIFQGIQVQGEMNEAMQYGARKIAAATTSISKEDAKKKNQPYGMASIAASKLLIAGYLKKNGCWTDAISGGVFGISTIESKANKEFIDLVVTYRIKLPIGFWTIKSLKVTQKVSARKWIGYTDRSSGEENDWVYITKNGSAYHKSLSCPYLDLTIRAVPFYKIGSLRNKSGGKYYPGSSAKKHSSKIVYITDYGTEYHTDLGCPELRRTVYRVKKSQVAGRHPCPKCYGGKK